MMARTFPGLLSALLLAGCGSMTASRNSVSNQAEASCDGFDISGKLREVESEQDMFARGEKALTARKMIEQAGPACVSQDDIATLARMVGEDNGEVQGSAALAIVAIGPKARSTIPAIRASLRREICGTSGVHPAGLLAYALEQFEAIKPGERLCETAEPVRRRTF